MSDPPAIGSRNDLIIDDEWTAVKTALVAILTYVTAPTHLSRLSIQGKESTDTRADEHYVSHDRGWRVDSAIGVVLP